MAITTIGEFAEALKTLVDNNESINTLEFPIDFKDPTKDDMVIINEYNTYLADGNYSAAFEYRNNHPELEAFIYDANKMNFLQTLVLTVHSAEGTKYDNSISGAQGTNVQDVLDECFQSVSDGKKLLASAITDKKINTDATATFAEMANNISKITLGSGNATVSNVLSGKTFTNDDGIEYTGEMTNNAGKTVSAKCSLDSTNKRVQLTAPSNAYYSTTSKLYDTYSSVASKIGLTAAKIVSGNTILGIAGTTKAAPTQRTLFNKKYNVNGITKFTEQSGSGSLGKYEYNSGSYFRMTSGYVNSQSLGNIKCISNEFPIDSYTKLHYVIKAKTSTTKTDNRVCKVSIGGKSKSISMTTTYTTYEGDIDISALSGYNKITIELDVGAYNVTTADATMDIITLYLH